MKTIAKFKHIDVPKQHGELARFKVVQGPDYGSIYVVLGNRVTIGRGEENDLVISDLKASRYHAELLYSAGSWTIQDKNSANGIKHNGKPTRQEKLALNDTITLGESTLEFVTTEAATSMLVAPPRSFNEIQNEQKKLAQRQEQLRSFGTKIQTSSVNPENQLSLLKDKRVLMIGGILVLFVLFLSGEEPPLKTKNKEKNQNGTADLASYLPDVEVSKTADTLFRDGFREFMAGNYNRARSQFETVLQIAPGHTLATLYIRNCENAVQEKVKLHLENGKKSFESGKIRMARANYERVLRLLYRDQANPAYIEAKEQLEKVNQQATGGYR